MAAITWRNVDGRSLAEAGSALNGAGQSMNNALGTLDALLKRSNAVQAQNWEAGKVNNSEAYKTAVDAVETPEQLAALKAQFAEMRAGYDGQIDPNLRNYADTRTDVLNTRIDQTRARALAERTRTEAPIQEAYRVAVLNGDEAAQAALRAANPGLSNWSALLTEERNVEAQTAAAKRAAELAPGQHTNALMQVADQTTQLNTARQVAALERETATAAQAYRQRQDTIGVTLGAIGKDQGLPVDAQGRLQMDLLTKEQYAWLDNAVSKQLPKDGKTPNILRMYESGDTEAADTYVKGLAGRYSPDIIEKSRAVLRGSFNTDNAQTIVGRDANNVARLDAQRKVIDDEARTANWHAPGSANAMNTYETVAKEIPMLIDPTSGFGSDEDVGPLQAFVHRMATIGVDVGGGKMVTPSVNDLRAVVRSAEGGWFTDAKRAKNAEANLIKIMRNSGSIAKIEEAEGIQMRDRKRAVKEALLPKK